MTPVSTSAPLGLTESIAHTIHAYPPTCIGCQRHGAHVMLSYTTQLHLAGSIEPVYDLFLTREQAQVLRNQLTHILTSTYR